MNKFLCHNCKQEFYSSEDKHILNCPYCDKEIINSSKFINKDNFLWIETMLRNIQTYGKEGTFKMIDKTYFNPITRVRVRKIYFDTVKLLEKTKGEKR